MDTYVPTKIVIKSKQTRITKNFEFKKGVGIDLSATKSKETSTR